MTNRERLTDLFMRLCRINTPPRKEGAIADYLQAHLERLGMSCCRDGSGPLTGSETGNLIATLPGTVPNAPAIFFAAHMDTVEPNPDLQIVVDGDVLRSDGRTILGADDRAGIAPLVEALETIVERNLPHGTIQAIFTVCEEIGLLGAKNLDRSLALARYGFVLDSGPPVGSIVHAAPSQDSMEIRIVGKPAHAGAMPEKGISAIEVAARAISRMRLGRIDFETTANVGAIHGGEATNIVCPEVVLKAEARSRDPGKLQQQVQHMLDALDEAVRHYGAQHEVRIEHQYDAYVLTEADPAVSVAKAAAERLGLPASLKAVGGGSDANVFNAMGLPACVLGTAMTDVHTHEEHASIEDLYQTSRWIVAIVEEVAARGC